MRYFRSARAIARTAFVRTNGFHRKRLIPDEMSDHMRRDLGLLDGRSLCETGRAGTDDRSRYFDLITPHGS
jgi:hypothetical protein